MALKQFYFIDACRTMSDVEDPTADIKIGGNKLARNDADAKPAAPIYLLPTLETLHAPTTQPALDSAKPC